MRIGVPKEVKVLENRVGLTPGSVREAVAHGHDVIVEHHAGIGIGMGDDAYRKAGATVVDSAAEIFQAAEMIVPSNSVCGLSCAFLADVRSD